MKRPVSMKRVVCLVVLLLPICAIAAPASDAARTHARRGTSLYSAGKYLEAASEFEAAYATRPDAGLLFNAAQAARLGGDSRKAQTLYSSYVSFHPDGSNVDEAKHQLEKIEAKLTEEEPRNGPTPQPHTVVVSNPPVAAVKVRARTPIHKRWWLWTAVIGGAGAVAAGVTLGLVLTRPAPAWTNVPDLGPGAPQPTSGALQLRF